MDNLQARYDSWSSEHKRPFGAVTPETRVRFVVEADAEAAGLSATLEVSGPDLKLSLPMELSPAGFAAVRLTCCFVPAKPGIYWYWFRLVQSDRELFLGPAEGEGGPSRQVHHHPRPYQLTVYSPQSMPSWAGEGAFYQVFVDRFRKAGDGLPTLKKGSLVHSSWNDTPFYVRTCKDGSVKRWTFFGGNLLGVKEKLPYLWEMGVNAVYLTPIFQSASNHKYDTGDYSKVDEGFGGDAALDELIEGARRWGIRIILDGVFSHTGSDSVYFNKDGAYTSLGAYQSKASPYSSWYTFRNHPDDYDCWWGFKGLPNVNELDPGYISFMVEGEDSIVRKWMRKGISGWRLDVADELPDEFIMRLKDTVRREDPDAMLIGEVWDDASNKVSYAVRREYLLGRELDSVTGYPVRDAILRFLTGKLDASGLKRSIMQLSENYPPEHFRKNLVIIGSHDVARAMTILGGAPDESSLDHEARESYSLPDEAKALARRRMKLAGLLQFLLPGTPMVYYGDEAGAEGYSDPYNRAPYPWGREDMELMGWFKALGEARCFHEALKDGSFLVLIAEGGAFAFLRRSGQDIVLAAVNASDSHARLDLKLSDADGLVFQDLFFGAATLPSVGEDGSLSLELPALSCAAYTATMPSKRLFPRLLLERSAGLLMHPTCLPSPFGIGGFGPEAYAFADFLQSADQKIWQVLPMNPPSLGNSPYMCYSAMAGNPLLISPEKLVEENLIDPFDIAEPPDFPEDEVDFKAAKDYKEALFRKAFQRFKEGGRGDGFRAFRTRNSGWLRDYALFMLFKGLYEDAPWQSWPEEIRQRDPEALATAAEANEDEVLYHEFLQYEYDRQWKALKKYANGQGIILVGDMAIYVAADSSDVWAAQDMFNLDPDGHPMLVSGVPPDSFSMTGQLWGHPVYRWRRHQEDGFSWWKARLNKSFDDFDYTRIDHFRGFAGYYAVPYGELTAERGRWLKGPGLSLFASMSDSRASLPIIVEDLGVITPDVVDMREALGFPGMKVMQFMDDVPGSESDDTHWVAYTGTHDNETLLQRYRTLHGSSQDTRPPDPKERSYVEGMLERLYFSPYVWAIAPMQDVLMLGAEARMNMPSTAEGNWRWRVAAKQQDEKAARRLKDLVRLGRR